MISFSGLTDVIAGDFSKLPKPRLGFILKPPRSEVRRTRYSGEQLRKIRAEKGVGRPKSCSRVRYVPGFRYFVLGWKYYPALWECTCGRESPNYYEWVMKTKPKDRSAA